VKAAVAAVARAVEALMAAVVTVMEVEV